MFQEWFGLSPGRHKHKVCYCIQFVNIPFLLGYVTAEMSCLPRPLVIRILFDVFAMIYVFALHRGWCMRHHGTHGIHVWYKRHTHTIHYTYTCIHTQPVFTLYTSKHRTSRNYIFQQSSTVTITSLIDKLSKCSVPFPTQFRLYLCK